MKRFACLFFLLLILPLLLLPGFVQADEPAEAERQKPKPPMVATSWGTIIHQQNGTGLIELHVKQWNNSESIQLPTPFGNITSAYYQH